MSFRERVPYGITADNDQHLNFKLKFDSLVDLPVTSSDILGILWWSYEMLREVQLKQIVQVRFGILLVESTGSAQSEYRRIGFGVSQFLDSPRPVRTRRWEDTDFTKVIGHGWEVTEITLV